MDLIHIYIVLRVNYEYFKLMLQRKTEKSVNFPKKLFTRLGSVSKLKKYIIKKHIQIILKGEELSF